MLAKAPIVVVMAAIFALFHIVIVAVPVLASGGSGETQAFAAAIFDLPIFWLLGLLPAGREVLYGSSQWLYILLFSVGGTLMYAAVGALVGCGIHIIIRAFRGNVAPNLLVRAEESPSKSESDPNVIPMHKK